MGLPPIGHIERMNAKTVHRLMLLMTSLRPRIVELRACGHSNIFAGFGHYSGSQFRPQSLCSVFPDPDGSPVADREPIGPRERTAGYRSREFDHSGLLGCGKGTFSGKSKSCERTAPHACDYHQFEMA